MTYKVNVMKSTDADLLKVAQIEPKMHPHRLKMFQRALHESPSQTYSYESKSKTGLRNVF